jgi:tRNA-splicing ligase RtcB (3'-phosphate/5'-hydroxy nucleic acid ligase)
MQELQIAKYPIKAWVDGVEFEAGAMSQVRKVANLPFIHRHVAVMPDVHVGVGATVGSVIATVGAIIPAAVGVDIGCGMVAVRTSLTADDLPTDLSAIRKNIERDVPVGQGMHRRVPGMVENAWDGIVADFARIFERYPKLRRGNETQALGTLGGGNHFIEVCLDARGQVWIMLHSGSRGIGNRTGQMFIELARRDMEKQGVSLEDRDLAYFAEGSEHFTDYVEAVLLMQRYAAKNRELMLRLVVKAIERYLPEFTLEESAINCHHNYVAIETHYGERCFVTRKGAVRAGKGELGIIPGSMGARSYIVRGKGNPEAFESCSHGAGRRMSRGEAKKTLTLADLRNETHGVECRKDEGVLDEAPSAYKDIDAVMKAQEDLVEPVAVLKQILCVKG